MYSRGASALCLNEDLRSLIAAQAFDVLHAELFLENKPKAGQFKATGQDLTRRFDRIDPGIPVRSRGGALNAASGYHRDTSVIAYGGCLGLLGQSKPEQDFLGLSRTSDRVADGLQDPGLDFAKFSVEKRPGGGPVPSPTELPCQLVAIDMAAGAEADFEATFELFDEDHCDLGPLDGQGQVDRIFGVAGKCSGFGKVFLANIRVDQLSVALVGRAGKNSTAQTDSSDGIAFVQIAVDRRWGCSLIDQIGDHSVGLAGRRVETEPTGIRGDRCIERIGHRFGDGDLGMLGAEGH